MTPPTPAQWRGDDISRTRSDPQGRRDHLGDGVTPHLDFLLSSIYDPHRLDHPSHLEDLRRSGLTDDTIRLQKITDVPPALIDRILGFSTPKVTSAYLLPFADPRGGWMDHTRMKVFPAVAT